jgi:hypothetical protein
METVLLIERTLKRRSEGTPEQRRFVIERPGGIEQAYAVIRETDARLPARARADWRWRIPCLRALIDYELLKNKGAVSDACQTGLMELKSIYHSQ